MGVITVVAKYFGCHTPSRKGCDKRGVIAVRGWRFWCHSPPRRQRGVITRGVITRGVVAVVGAFAATHFCCGGLSSRWCAWLVDGLCCGSVGGKRLRWLVK